MQAPFDDVNAAAPDGHAPKQRRNPATINLRPGRGGAQRRLDLKGDPAEGLERFGEVTWWPVPGPGTMLGLIERQVDGNAVALCRLSGEDRDDTLIDQVEKALALEAGNSETLSIRYILLALDMSGTREVRPPRALPAPAHILERDDIVQFERWVKEGWVEHAIWRDGRRIAREVLPAEMIVRILRENRVNLWLSSYGRAIDWNSDRLGIRALNLVAAEDRDNTERMLQEARLRRGPFAGNGWRNSPPRFGFVREPKTLELVEDDEQWPWIHRAHELADVGTFADEAGLSTRAIAKALADEGCPFDHDRIRQILKDPIYATGEWHVHVRGIPVAQLPLALKNPVPLDRFLRNQAKLELRQGSTKRTPLGEFLFNYVEVVHKQCAGELWKNGSPVLIKGHIAAGRESQRRLRHSPSVPAQCKGKGRALRGAFTWDRSELQDPVVKALRELVEHPEVLEQARLAARHQIACATPQLSDDQREQLQRDLIEIRQREQVAAEEWVDRAVRDSSIGIDEYQRVAAALKRKRESIERRLDADVEDQRTPAERATPQNVEELKRAFLEIMSVETPSDPLMRQVRARLFQILVSRIEIDDDGGPANPITITVEGHLVPPTGEGAASPLVAARELLESYAAARSGQTPEAERRLDALDEKARRVAEEAEDVETAYQYGYHKSVSTLSSHFFALSRRELKALRRQRLDATEWHMRRDPVREDWGAAWCLTVEVAPSVDSNCGGRPSSSHLILDTLASLGEASAAELTQETSLSLQTVRRWVKELCASGAVEQTQLAAGARSGLFRLRRPSAL
jgi:predicted ArsR family transcriptional regulator